MSKHAHEHEKNSKGLHPEDGSTAAASVNEQKNTAVPQEKTQAGETAFAEVSATLKETEASESTASKEEDLKQQLAEARIEIEQLKIQLAELNDKYLRALAEQVNFRKRVVRDKEEAQRYAVQSLLSDLLVILDDFDRSIEEAKKVPENGSRVLEGVEMIRRNLMSLLENKYGLKQYRALNEIFDPNLHEAMFSDSGDVTEPTVTQEFLPGYMLHERVIRPAKVKVTMPAAPQNLNNQVQGTNENSAQSELS